MEKESIVYKGIYYEGDIYQQIYEATGIDIKNDLNYRIGFVGADDDMGISETQYSEFYVYKKIEKTTKTPPITPIIPINPQEKEKKIIGGISNGFTGETSNYEKQDPSLDPSNDLYTKGKDKVIIDDLDVIIDEDPRSQEIPKEIERVIDKYINDEQEIEETKFIRVIRKYTNKATKWLCLLSLILILLSGIKTVDKTKINVETITTTSIGYVVQLENGDSVEITNEQLQQIIGEMGIGDYVQLQKGDELFWDSLLRDPKAVIGNGIREPGKYQISGISIVYGDKIIDFEVDLNVENPGLKISDFVKETCEKYSLDVSKINVMLHIGNSKNNTRTGWIDATKLLTIEHIDKDLINNIAKESATYTDTIENFKGSNVTFKTANGEVTIDIKDQNGNFYTPGTKVIGSDGNEYIIQDLSVTNTKEEFEKEVTDGKKLTWRIQDCNLAIGLLPLVAALATDIATKKKNEEAQRNPKFFEFENEFKYQEFKKDFEKRKEKYENTSNFRKLIKRAFFRKEVDLL